MPFVPSWTNPAWHLFVIRHTLRDALQKELAKAGIGSLIHYPVPPPQSDAYSAEFRQKSFTITEQLANTVLSLPIGPHCLQSDVSEVINVIKKFRI